MTKLVVVVVSIAFGANVLMFGHGIDFFFFVGTIVIYQNKRAI